MIYITPPTVDEPSWKLQSIQPELNGKKSYHTHAFNISEKIAKLLAERGVPVTLPGQEPIGATEKAITDALDYLNLKGSNRLIKALMCEVRVLAGTAEGELPQVWWDCRRAEKAIEEAEAKYEELHEKLLEYAYEKLGLTDLEAILVEGTHECVGSPIRRCLYDDEEDPSHDNCLVCGEPEERK